jgi:hypothetical protein
MTGAQCRRRSKPNELAQAAPYPIALHGIADLLTDGESNAGWSRFNAGAGAGLQDKGAGIGSHTMGPHPMGSHVIASRTAAGSLGNGPKVTPAFQPLHCSDFGMTAF